MSSDLLQTLVEDPTQVFSKSTSDSNYFETLVKKYMDPIIGYSKLDEVYIEGLDASQIFGQSKLVVENAGMAIMEKIEELGGIESDLEESVSEDGSEEDVEDDLKEPFENEDEQEEEEEIEVQEEDSFDDQSEAEVEAEDAAPAESDDDEFDESKIKKDAYGLNDGFFDLEQFQKQVLALEDEDLNADDDEEIDYFAEVNDEDEIDYYNDFYDKPNQEPKKSLLDDDEEHDDAEEPSDNDDGDLDSLNEEEFNNALGEMREDLYEEKSTFEKQQEKLQQEINKLEDELVAEKKWTMKGEVRSSQRPEDSLLNDQEDFDFDRVGKPVPIITEEITETIEDLIRKRVKAEEFDDLPKRFLNEIVKPRKERVEVSETKSSKSLAEIYEDKYKGVETTNEKEEQLTKDHQEIKELFNNVNYKLDALTSFNFVPKPYENKVIEVKNATIEMEDSQPEFVSNETRLAPQEVFNKDEKNSNEIALKSGLSYSKDELSKEEKQRLRRANKRKRSKHFKEQAAKKPKTESIVDTLSKNKNLTIINKSGEKTDIKGNLKKHKEVTSNNLKL